MNLMIQPWKRYILGISLIIIVLYIAHAIRLPDRIQDANKYLESFGVSSPIIFMVLMALAVIIVPIPSAPLTLSAGILYGTWLGTLYSVIGAALGAAIAFMLSRLLGRGWIYRMFKRDLVFCNPCTTKYLTVLVFVLRLIPFVQFDIISYGAGLTAIPFTNYIIATVIGMLPSTFVEVAVGNVFGLTTSGLVISILVMLAVVILPVIIKRTNLFGLKKYIYHSPHLEK